MPELNIFLTLSPSATLCQALEVTGLAEDLDGDVWTVLAPTDAAFEELGQDNLDYFLGNDTEALADLLLLHLIAGEAVASSDLPCQAGSNLITMANEDSVRM